MMTTLLHLSDPHFGNSKGVLDRNQIKTVLVNLLEKAGRDAFLVLSGDISYRGKVEGYAEARTALRPVLEQMGVQRGRIIVCPGNHDVTSLTENGSSYFMAFDEWSSSMRDDVRCTFSSSSCVNISFPEVDFLVINSSYHGDIEYGLVDLDEMDVALGRLLSSAAPNRPRVAVLHHHLIPFSERGDGSATRNAYKVLTRLVKHNFLLTMHGHQHALLDIGVGGGAMKLFGVGSFRYSNPGFINGASIYRINDANQVSSEHYAISLETSGLVGRFSDF